MTVFPISGNHKPTFKGWLEFLRLAHLLDREVGRPGRKAGWLYRQDRQVGRDDAGAADLLGMRRPVDDRVVVVGGEADSLVRHVGPGQGDDLEGGLRILGTEARPGAGGPLLVRVDQENLEALLGEAGGDIDR